MAAIARLRQFVLLAAVCGTCVAAATPAEEFSCGEPSEIGDDAMALKARAMFLEHTHGRIRHYEGRRMECMDRIGFQFEGIGPDANPGNGCVVFYVKGTGKMEIVDLM
jgi:hypothetical protein